jgi:hypothetical protein
VSLWDLVIFCSGVMLFRAGLALESLKCDCFMKTGIGQVPLPAVWFKGPVDEHTIAKSLEYLAAIREECVRLGMPVSAETVAEIEAVLALSDTSYQRLQVLLDNLKELIQKELKTKVFLHVTPDRMRFWPTEAEPSLFGEQVRQAFPSATFDIHESGMCLALARGTASVFHLMRVLEIGLAALGAVFDVSLAHTNWAPAIEEIEKQIRDMHKESTWKALPGCKEQQEFYSQAASHFGILKDAWRNYTAHVRGVYTEERAALIFDNVRVFMQSLATRLHE